MEQKLLKAGSFKHPGFPLRASPPPLLTIFLKEMSKIAPAFKSSLIGTTKQKVTYRKTNYSIKSPTEESLGEAMSEQGPFREHQTQPNQEYAKMGILLIELGSGLLNFGLQ